MSDTHELSTLYARLDDLCARAERGEPVESDFLSPREVHYAEMYLKRSGACYLAFGGYADAERKKLFVLPDYMESVNDLSELEEYGFEPSLCAVRIRASGYRKLSHRDYLGSILGLGVERSVVGDILVCGENGAEAFVICSSAMAQFFTSELDKVANDKVKVTRISISDAVIPERCFAPINDTVASPRLDCIVGALCSLSREKAREVVVSGFVEADYECEERPDRILSAPCLVSVRGFGKYRVISVNDMTKKGRYRLVAEKFL